MMMSQLLFSYDIEFENVFGDNAGNGVPQGTVLTFQPVFITNDSDDVIKYGLVKGDTYSKLIYPKIMEILILVILYSLIILQVIL